MAAERDLIGDPLSLLVRVNELQEAVQMYERLQMKNEFLYSMRMYVLSLLQLGDMLRLKELLNEYKFLFTWEEERAFEIAQRTNKGAGVTAESAFSNIMSLVVGPQPAEEKDAPMEQAEGVKRGNQIIEKPVHLVCGGLEKRIVF